MAPKDYVKRGRVPAKETPPPRKPLPWVVIMLTLIVGAVLAYGLFMINGASDKPTPALSQKNAPVEKQQEPLPEVPQEKWEFIDTLENQEVEVEVPDDPAEQKDYQMQCGSFRIQDQAETMRAQLAMIGKEAFIKTTDGKNGIWHRVVLGPYHGKRAAERDRHQIRKLGITTCQIWGWN